MFFSWGEGGYKLFGEQFTTPQNPIPQHSRRHQGCFVLCLEGMGFWNQSKSSINLMEVMWFTGALLLSSDFTRMERDLLCGVTSL